MEKPSANPKHNTPLMSEEDRYNAEMMRLYQAHKAAGSMGIFYELYPHMRPRENDRER